MTCILLCALFVSCSNETQDSTNQVTDAPVFISAVDISSFPEISEVSPVFYNEDGVQNGFLNLLKANGVNTIRLRLWVNPTDGHSGFNEVKSLAETLRTYGFNIWLCLHYSDTWADPGNQALPSEWENDTYTELKTRISDYTAFVVTEIQPELIQIGNEINSGFLFPHGAINSNPNQFRELLATAISAVRSVSPTTKIMIHYAGMEGADWFFNQVSTLDYDVIGLSYYPIWHGNALSSLQQTMQSLSNIHDKEIIIAETAYPFTLDWNDWTNNIVGLQEHLILPEFPATPTGQKDFISSIKSMAQQLEKGLGFCYWGAELIAWKGDEAVDASPWENQALFDFENKALPVLSEFLID